MKLPNKVVSYNESIISKFPLILDILREKDYTVTELFEKIKSRMAIEDFIDAIDSLYALGRIGINGDTRKLHYVV